MTDEIAPKSKGGRPKGSKNATTLLQEAVLTESQDIILNEFPKIVRAVVKKAAEGDLKAAKLIMDRVIPARKAIEHNQAKGNTGVTIVVQGIAQVEEGRPVLEHNLDKLELIQQEEIPNERQTSSGRQRQDEPE